MPFRRGTVFPSETETPGSPINRHRALTRADNMAAARRAFDLLWRSIRLCGANNSRHRHRTGPEAR
jgi:hypothetical protein